ncbi:MAG: hypothetical protein EPO55_20245 [Reyranella sp.]|uniref:hypothetical protein n=1 Tax=Reyranella sp. TaxID=1929291 RepID=UPI00121FFFBE|nr:hypothetical protein [Reyranella sp.]TAJ36858.1 MAG: hypothetical protein EPO55_20245 [Reyranella sp.]
MARPEIVDKLDAFLTAQMPPAEERDIVYLLVEIRKIIDHDNAVVTYPILKFYADWCVHTRKDRLTKEMIAILGDIYNAAAAAILQPHSPLGAADPARDFIYMSRLRNDLRRFLSTYGLPGSLVDSDDNWVSFVALLVKVLENQPIIDSSNKLGNVSQFTFLPANARCVIGRMDFKTPVAGNPFYQIGNFY